MLLERALSVLLSSVIALLSYTVVATYAYADKDRDKHYDREKYEKKWDKKHRPESYSKKDHKDYKRDKKHDRSKHRPRPDRHGYYPYRPYPYYDDDDHYEHRPYRPPAIHYGTRPRHEYHYHKGKKYKKYIVIPSWRHYDHYIHIRPFRHSYPHYRPLYVDNDFWGWLALSFIALQLLDHLNDDQRHAHERALYRATRAPIGETIYWSDTPEVVGSVTPVWEGPSNTGQYCREYRHEISISDRTEVAYGTACRRPDGTWEIVQ